MRGTLVCDDGCSSYPLPLQENLNMNFNKKTVKLRGSAHFAHVGPWLFTIPITNYSQLDYFFNTF